MFVFKGMKCVNVAKEKVIINIIINTSVLIGCSLQPYYIP